MNRLLLLTPKAETYVTLLRERNLPDLQLNSAANSGEGRRFIIDSNVILGVPKIAAELLPEAKRLAWVQSTFAGIESLCAPGL